MKKTILNENEQKIINEAKDPKFKELLTEGFKRGTIMTADEFCRKLEMLKTSLIKKHKMRDGNDNC
jgi:hypothetical protein